MKQELKDLIKLISKNNLTVKDTLIMFSNWIEIARDESDEHIQTLVLSDLLEVFDDVLNDV